MRNFLIIILISLSSSLFAQARLDHPEMYIGTSHGVIGSMVFFSPSVSQGYLLGYNGSLVFRYIAEKNVGMQLELHYSQRGWSESPGDYERQLNYIEMPFMTHIYVGNKTRAFLNIGPKISYLISENVKTSSSSQEVQHTSDVDYPFDYGLCAGLGFLVNVKGNVLQLDTRANFGLSDIFSNKKVDYFEKSNNFNVSINLAWLLQIK